MTDPLLPFGSGIKEELIHLFLVVLFFGNPRHIALGRGKKI